MKFPARRKDADAKPSESVSRKSPKHQGADADRVLRDINREKSREERRRKRALRKQTSRKRAHTAQGFIGYEQMIEDGVCWVDNNLWSRSFRFSDITRVYELGDARHSAPLAP